MLEIEEHREGVILKVWLQPGASGTEVVGIHNKLIKIRVSSPPTAGKANRECRHVLAKLFGVSASKVTILSGKTNRCKKILLSGAKATEVYSVLREKGILID
jgi:uncharacterized protein (TIGR00251 family)